MDSYIYPIINNEAGLPFLVCGIGINKHQCHITREDGYCIHQIIYCTGGKGVLLIDGKQIEISQGMLFYLPPDIPHEYYQISSEPWSTNWITFVGENITDWLAKLEMSEWCVYKGLDLESVDTIFRRIFTTLKNDAPFSGYVVSGVMYELLIEIFRLNNDSGTLESTQENTIIKPIISYINENFHKQLSLQELADVARITPEHLCKVFRAHMNMRPFEYLAKRRVQEAKRLLNENCYSISQIGKMVGYNNNSYFCSVFRKYEHISPSEFRGNVN